MAISKAQAIANARAEAEALAAKREKDLVAVCAQARELGAAMAGVAGKIADIAALLRRLIDVDANGKPVDAEAFEEIRVKVAKQIALGWLMKRYNLTEAKANETLSDGTESAKDARLAANRDFGRALEKAEIVNPKSKGKGESKPRAARPASVPADEVAEAPATEAPATVDPSDASTPTLSVHAPVGDIVAALMRLAPVQFVETIAAAVAGKHHAPGKINAPERHWLEAVLEANKARKAEAGADKAEAAKDVTPKAEAPATEPAKRSRKTRGH